MRRWGLVLLSLSVCLAGLPAQARVVESQGEARIVAGDLSGAREQAIHQAVRQAITRAGVQVTSTTKVNDMAVSEESTSYRSTVTARDVVVLDEMQDGERYRVSIRAQLIEPPPRDQSLPVRYRKKLATLQFAVLDRTHITDLPAVEQEIPRELARRLVNTNQFLIADGASHVLSDSALTRLDGRQVAPSEAIVRVAQALGVQFVVLGTIRDMQVVESQPRLRRVLSFAPWVFQSGRRFVIDVSLYDGLTGTLISQRRVNEWVEDGERMMVGSSKATALNVDSRYGRVIDQVLGRLSDGLMADMATLPFMARVVAVDAGLVSLDAGASSLITVGDALMAYRVGGAPVQEHGSSRLLGLREAQATALKISQVQPQFSLAKAASGNAGLKPGDIVRLVPMPAQ